jgi:hypothetical protein
MHGENENMKLDRFEKLISDLGNLFKEKVFFKNLIALK